MFEEGEWDRFKLFVTTDLDEVGEEARREFGEARVIMSAGRSVHIDYSETCEHVKKTFVDLHFMQHCDRIVISESNFGKFGVMLRPKPARDAFIFREGVFRAIDDSLKF